MKRHPSLQDLSRDHHHALIHAQQMRRSNQGEGGARPLRDVAKEFLRFWEQDASPHFREEEEVLLPICARHVPPSQDPDICQMLDDHAWFRDTMVELQRRVNEGDDLRELVSQISRRLDDHIRLEERRIFERMQDAMTGEDLADLGARSRAFRGQWRAPGCVGPRSGDDCNYSP